MLFRGIKHQVDKGPVDWVTGKAKYTLNDNRLLREDLEYRTLVRTPFVPSLPSLVSTNETPSPNPVVLNLWLVEPSGSMDYV